MRKQKRASTQRVKGTAVMPRIAIRDSFLSTDSPDVIAHVITSYNESPLVVGKLTLKLPTALSEAKYLKKVHRDGKNPGTVRSDKYEALVSRCCETGIYLAPRPGLEPGTYGLTVRRSTD
jgi:hypothetical protein